MLFPGEGVWLVNWLGNWVLEGGIGGYPNSTYKNTLYRQVTLCFSRGATTNIDKTAHLLDRFSSHQKQECIPVGCIPAAHRPYAEVCFLAGCLVQGGLLLGGCLLWGGGGVVCSQGGGIPACIEADPPVNRMTNRCKNITLATTSLRLVKSLDCDFGHLEIHCM